MCAPSEPEQLHAAETEEPGSEGPAPGPEGQPKRTTSLWRLHHAKGQESSICLRSSDCAAGLCCARHFWSKICKPVLKEGQDWISVSPAQPVSLSLKQLSVHDR
ncbi:dickkopf-related protein 1 [Alligator mississippiensis]|uniref:Dickkopf-related protein 1 n=1 Tax=Alligator mississippiensis TaxID=8496 RepID=A0A151NZR5_ALLMI|nr:dickkopf-related protein 1 [Alligator mississippiensis]